MQRLTCNAARVVAQVGCDHGLHQHAPLRVQSIPAVGGVIALVDMARFSYTYQCKHYEFAGRDCDYGLIDAKVPHRVPG